MNEQERLIIEIDTRLNALNRAIEDELKPALQTAITEVLSQLLNELSAISISVAKDNAE